MSPKLIAIAICLTALSGCGTQPLPVLIPFPTPPGNLMQPPASLLPLMPLTTQSATSPSITKPQPN